MTELREIKWQKKCSWKRGTAAAGAGAGMAPQGADPMMMFVMLRICGAMQQRHGWVQPSANRNISIVANFQAHRTGRGPRNSRHQTNSRVIFPGFRVNNDIYERRSNYRSCRQHHFCK